eukprot:GILI01005372.1.p1 GENE.GILI01005372.1~~GILI01005372.1.p1  ORF type:complete len:275 (-),score=125.50 GILI01005372.1:189-896(-)
MSEEEDEVRNAVANAFSTCLILCPSELSSSLISQLCATAGSAEWTERHTALLTLGSGLHKEASWPIFAPLVSQVLEAIRAGLGDDKLPVKQGAIVCAGRLLSAAGRDSSSMSTIAVALVEGLSGCLADTNSDIRRVAVNVLRSVAKRSGVLLPHLSVVVPALMPCVRDANISVKLAAERSLMHVLQLKKSQDVLNTYLKDAEPSHGKFLSDYVKRVIAKIVQQEEGAEEVESDVE